MKNNKNLYKSGTLVYFHAYADSKDKSTYFMCQGIIVKTPKNNKDYKITITAINPRSVLCGENTKIAATLLGRNIFKKENKLSNKPTDWMNKFYKNPKWIEVSKHNLQKILNKAKKDNEQNNIRKST